MNVSLFPPHDLSDPELSKRAVQRSRARHPPRNPGTKHTSGNGFSYFSDRIKYHLHFFDHHFTCGIIITNHPSSRFTITPYRKIIFGVVVLCGNAAYARPAALFHTRRQINGYAAPAVFQILKQIRPKFICGKQNHKAIALNAKRKLQGSFMPIQNWSHRLERKA
ncbi:MAG: hypothetical protein II767_06070 [Proteobacteria bacterium]|nr:hypothetical protein [Pseudomonadota bacterium]